MHLDTAKTILEALKSIEAGDRRFDCGICPNLKRLTNKTTCLAFQRMMFSSGWLGWSTLPRSSDSHHILAKDCWTGGCGEVSKDLLRHLIEKFEERVNGM